jgi:bifunctional UDP-N-acetylglucosamine pyrophosphorylase / glucosamine-1-phosphate N-acetyltransferase
MSRLPKAAVVLAAGKGKRMKSDLPKVLHPIHDRPMISILMDTLHSMTFEQIAVVIGYKGEMVQKALSDYPVTFVWQTEQLGTGHAVMMAEPELKDFRGTVLVAAGDVPFLSQKSISRLFEVHESTAAAATCLSAVVDDPTGYGRIIRVDDSDQLARIVEHKDADQATLQIREINTGTLCFDAGLLFSTLQLLKNDNAQGEYYLTDCVKILHEQGRRVSVVCADNSNEVLGVNSVDQLRDLERRFNG